MVGNALARRTSWEARDPSGLEVPTSRASALEEALADRVEARHAVAVVSGAVAMEIAYRAAGVAHGSAVMLSPFAGRAATNGVLACGGRPVLADVDGRGHLDPTAVAHRVALGGGPAVVVAVHRAGHPSDVATLAAAAPGATVIEDAREAIGAVLADGRPAGACAHAALAVIALGTSRGAGAAVVTDDALLAARCRRLRDERVEGRISELHATLGCVTLVRLEAQTALRARIAATYDAALAGVSLVRPVRPAPGTRSAWCGYGVLLPAALRPHVADALARAGVAVRLPAVPLHRRPAYRRLVDVLPAELPTTERLWSELLWLPCAATTQGGEAAHVAATLVGVLGGDLADARPAW